MLDVVEKESRYISLDMKIGHKMQILARLKAEKIRRDEEEKEKLQAMEKGKKPRAKKEKQPRETKERQYAAPASANRYILWQGLGCMNSHWLCFFGVTILFAIVSLSLFILQSQLVTSYDEKDNQGQPINSTWKFVQVLWIIGFSFAGVTMLMCFCACFRDPNSRFTVPSCIDCCGEDNSCMAKLCPEADPDEPSCCSSCCHVLHEALQSCLSALQACWHSVSECACCRDCQLCSDDREGESCCGCCGDDDSPSSCPSCSLTGFCPECADIDCSCSLTEVCPSCDGLSGAFDTCFKILCCQCKIQVA